MTPSLRLDGLAAERGDRLLFKGLACTLGPGDALLVTGPNGTGKSTLLRILAGLLDPLSGTVTHSGGLALATADADALDHRLPLAAALDHWARLDGTANRVGPAMTAMAIAHLADVPVRMLSTGQRKRAGLARTVASGAGIWLLDEPGNGLDVDGLARLAKAMADHRATGGIVIAASHQPLDLTNAQHLNLAKDHENPRLSRAQSRDRPSEAEVANITHPDVARKDSLDAPPEPDDPSPNPFVPSVVEGRATSTAQRIATTLDPNAEDKGHDSPAPDHLATPAPKGTLSPLLRRDIAQHYSGGAATLPILFFLMVATLFPFAIGPDGALLARTGGGALWMAALLAALLPVDRLIEPDRAAGIFDQYAVRRIGAETATATKLLAHWLGFAPPLMLAVLPAAALLRLDATTVLRIETGLALGTPGLAALGILTAALTAGLRGAGALAGLVMLPLAVPLLIFGAGALGDQGSGALKLLAATSLLLIAITPFAGGAALRAARA